MNSTKFLSGLGEPTLEFTSDLLASLEPLNIGHHYGHGLQGRQRVSKK